MDLKDVEVANGLVSRIEKHQLLIEDALTEGVGGSVRWNNLSLDALRTLSPEVQQTLRYMILSELKTQLGNLQTALKDL